MGVFTRQQHPGREALFEYAEQIENGGPVAFKSEISAHLRECAVCAAEVRGMRHSLKLTHSIKTLEPTNALQASVILGMKAQRVEAQRQARRRMMRRTAIAAGFMTVLGAIFQGAPTAHSSQSGVVRLGPDASFSHAPIAIESLREPSPEEALLEPAINASYWRPANSWEKSQARALQAMDADIDEALAALHANPALVRAGAVIHSSRELKSKTLKSLYAQRSL